MTKNLCSENQRLRQKTRIYRLFACFVTPLRIFPKGAQRLPILHKHFNKSADYVNKCVQYMPPRPVKNSDPQWIWDCQ